MRCAHACVRARAVALSERRLGGPASQLIHARPPPPPPSSKPQVVVITHRLEYNIYHWTTESMGKLAALLDYIHGHPHVRIHVGLVSKKKSRDALFRH